MNLLKSRKLYKAIHMKLLAAKRITTLVAVGLRNSIGLAFFTLYTFVSYYFFDHKNALHL